MTIYPVPGRDWTLPHHAEPFCIDVAWEALAALPKPSKRLAEITASSASLLRYFDALLEN